MLCRTIENPNLNVPKVFNRTYLCKEFNMRMLSLALLSLMLTACPNPYMAAKQTIFIGRNVTSMTGAAFDTALDTKKQECIKVAPETDPKYAECMKSMTNTYGIWKRVERIAGASWSEADAVVTAAEQKHQGLPVDWMRPVKQGVCVLAECLAFLPESVKKYIDPILALVKTFTCEQGNK
jgi:hypothetical protein